MPRSNAHAARSGYGGLGACPPRKFLSLDVLRSILVHFGTLFHGKVYAYKLVPKRSHNYKLAGRVRVLDSIPLVARGSWLVAASATASTAPHSTVPLKFKGGGR